MAADQTAFVADLLKSELRWSRKMQQWQPQREASESNSSSDALAATRGFYELIVEAKIRAFDQGRIKQMPLGESMISQRCRVGTNFALIASTYPEIGSLVFKIDSASDPLAFEAIKVITGMYNNAKGEVPCEPGSR
jgi:hypothetical protein